MIVDRTPPFLTPVPNPWPKAEEEEDEDIEDAPTVEAFPFHVRVLANPNPPQGPYHANLR